MKSFIVELWSDIFSRLRWISVFELVRRVFPQSATAGFVELWVLSHLALAFVLAVLSPWLANSPAKYVVAAYGAIRVFEIIVYQTNVLLFDEYRTRKAGKEYALHGYRRIVILLLHNYFEIIFWFGATYMLFQPLFSFRLMTNSREMAAIIGIYSSFAVMTTVGEPNVSSTSIVGSSMEHSYICANLVRGIT